MGYKERPQGRRAMITLQCDHCGDELLLAADLLTGGSAAPTVCGSPRWFAPIMPIASRFDPTQKCWARSTAQRMGAPADDLKLKPGN
jgi:hypothetical protein